MRNGVIVMSRRGYLLNMSFVLNTEVDLGGVWVFNINILFIYLYESIFGLN